MSIQVGTMVTIEAQGSRNDKGQVDVVPAVVTKIWPDGSLGLYVLHFAGTPQNIHSIKRELVEVVDSKPEPKFSMK